MSDKYPECAAMQSETEAALRKMDQLDRLLAAKDAEIERLKTMLAEYTDWKPGIGMMKHTKPFHGPCCCCQECGHGYDDCVCEHNTIETFLRQATPEQEKP